MRTSGVLLHACFARMHVCADLYVPPLPCALQVFETEVFECAGHVKASACAGIAFLACHPIGAEGEWAHSAQRVRGGAAAMGAVAEAL